MVKASVGSSPALSIVRVGVIHPISLLIFLMSVGLVSSGEDPATKMTHSESPLKKKFKIHGSNLVRGKNFSPVNDSPPTRPHRSPWRKIPKVSRRIIFGELHPGLNRGDVMYVPATPDKRYARDIDLRPSELTWTEV